MTNMNNTALDTDSFAKRAADERAGAIFEALSDPTRRAVVRLLSQSPQRAGALAAAAGVSPSLMSRHLRVLLNVGIAVDERLTSDARARVFRLRPAGVRTAQQWLGELQILWDSQLANFQQHVEASVSAQEVDTAASSAKGSAPTSNE